MVDTKEKILTAVSYMAMTGIKVNKNRIAIYTGLSWRTVHHYIEDVIPYDYKLVDIKRLKLHLMKGDLLHDKR